MISLEWRGSFSNVEVNDLHSEAFGTRVFDEAEWNWQDQTAAHSLGWVTARNGQMLVGFANVLWDGFVHAWIQDVMVATSSTHNGIGSLVVHACSAGAKAAGCEWLHVDFEEQLRPFYIDACGFTPSAAGLIDLTD